MEPCVSVIIPLYNVESYMRKCVNSVLNQTLNNIEIILVDDGSPDNCGEIADEYAKKDVRVKVIHKLNGGLSSARNSGLTIATGEYVSFIDSDDWVELNMLESLYKRAKEGNADLVVCNFDKVYENHTKENHLNINSEVINLQDIGLNGYLFKYFFSDTHGVMVWNKLYRREIIQMNELYFHDTKEILSEDILFNLCFFSFMKIVCTVESPFYSYLQRPGSLMNISRPNASLQMNLLFWRYVDHLKELDKIQTYEDEGLPIVFYKLTLSGLSLAYRNDSSVWKLRKNLINLASTPCYRIFIKQLIYGDSVKKYRALRTNRKKSHIEIKIYSILSLFKMYMLLALLLSYGFKRVNKRNQS